MAVVLALIGVNKFGAPGNALCYAVLLWMALRSTEGALKALLLSSIIIMTSRFFITASPVLAVSKFLLLFAAAFRFVQDARRWNPKALTRNFLYWLAGFSLTAALLAIMNGYYAHISLLKLLNFTVGVYALLVAGQARHIRRIAFARWMLAVTLVILSMNAFSLAAGVGKAWMRSYQGGYFFGFRGMFTHSQTLGLIMAFMIVFWLIYFVTNIGFQKDWKFLGMIGGGVYFLYLSNTRTGMIGMILAVALSYTLILMFSSRKKLSYQLKRLKANFRRIVGFGAVIILVFMAVSGNQLFDSAKGFLQKDDAADIENPFNIYEVFQNSRGGQMEYNWRQFREHPWTGVGFGVDTSARWQQGAGLLSASTERGFWPSAILAEVGVVGFILFIGFAATLIHFLVKNGYFIGVAITVAMLVVNFGEMMLFSFGGLGMVSWTLIACAMVLSGGGNFPPTHSKHIPT